MRTPAAQRKLFGRLALRYPRAIRIRARLTRYQVRTSRRWMCDHSWASAHRIAAGSPSRMSPSGSRIVGRRTPDAIGCSIRSLVRSRMRPAPGPATSKSRFRSASVAGRLAPMSLVKAASPSIQQRAKRDAIPA
jgi:hypothetical protein